MTALIVYLFVTFVLAILISLMHAVLADRLEERGWGKPWGWLARTAFIILAPITVPWWLVCFIRANKGGG